LELSYDVGTPSVDNDVELTELVGRVARDVLGADQVATMPRASMGSEDFAGYLQHVPGTMFRLGCAGEQSPWPGLHTPTFDVDEKCIAVGAKILARSVVEWSKPNQSH
jgi:metal-dependent amidase/aminoacylase/carboxypeptidase family protein